MDVHVIRAKIGPDILIVEDAAQATVGYLPGEDMIGSSGDLVVHSFNRTKILEASGGALVIPERELFEGCRESLEDILANKAMEREREEVLRRCQRDICSGLAEGMRIDVISPKSAFLAPLTHSWKELYQQPNVPRQSLERSWSELESNIAHRIHMADLYHEGLRGLPVNCFEAWRSSKQIWRFTFSAGLQNSDSRWSSQALPASGPSP